jgi:YhcH/YjgK/YiaL family protein
MIKISNYQDLKQYFNVPDAALAFLAAISENTDNGKYPFGADCFINVMDCTTREELADMEAHDVYVDVQCLFSGEERIYYKNREGLTVTKPLNPDKDVLFFAYTPSEYVDYKAGECVVLYPEEAHLPGRAPNASMTIKKAVMKLNHEKLRK